jgi:hypothetical protein
LVRTSWRLHLCLIITLAGLAAFLTSLLALRLGLSSMALRYPLAVAGGYIGFLVLIRGWIAWQRRSLEAVRDVIGDAISSIDLSDANVARSSSAAEPGLSAGAAVAAEVVARVGDARFCPDARLRLRRAALTSASISMNCGRLWSWPPARLADSPRLCM